ncbi:MAG: serine hydrolase domain-containing protein [Pseudomonadota bacterium]
MFAKRLSVLFLSFLILPCAFSAQHTAGDLEEFLKELAASASIPGLSFGYTEKGTPPQLITVGLADTEKAIAVADNTVFEAASLSKPVLALIVLKLVERGELALDEPLAKTLKNDRVANAEWGNVITATHVLAHQTGFPNWADGELPIAFQPGSSFSYSGEGYVYLQRVVEKVTGLPLQALARREVFDPLGMNDSFFTATDSHPADLAQGHDRAGNQVTRQIREANAASSLQTTPADYLKFVRAWFDADFLQPASRNKAFAPVASKTQGDPPTEMAWGLGWGIHGSGDERVVWHWGDNGVFRALVVAQPASEQAFVFFANSQNGLAIARQLSEKLLPGTRGISDWLNYGQADTPGWQAEQQGYELEAQGRYREAQMRFASVLREFPDNQRLKGKIAWLEPLINKPESQVNLDPETLARLVGDYGERRLFLEDGVLTYQRGQGVAHRLTPYYGNVFKVGDLGGFRLQVVFDEGAAASKLIGLYDNGFTDESPRTQN